MSPSHSRPTILMLYYLFAASLVAQSYAATPQDDWEFPSAPDKSSTLYKGSTYTIEWVTDLESWFDGLCSTCDPTDVELWVTTTDNTYSEQLSSSVDVSSTTSYTWTVNIPSSKLDIHSLYVLRFLQSWATYMDTSQQISSSIFYVYDSSQTVTSLTTTTLFSQVTSSTTATDVGTASTTSSSAPSSSTKSDSSSTALSTAAEVGISIGVIVVGMAFAGLLWFFIRRWIKREPRTSQRAPDYIFDPPPPSYTKDSLALHNVPATGVPGW